MSPDRKPLAPAMQSREPHSIRYTPDEWAAIAEASRVRGLEPAVFVRMLTIYALSITQAQLLQEASLGLPGQWLGGSPQMLRASAGTRRF